MKNNTQTRRNFIKKVLLGSAGMSVLTAGQMSLIKSAMAASSGNVPTGYKALVCIYLYGGNDSPNMLVPVSGQARSDYEVLRGGLSVQNPLEINLSINGVDGGLGFNPVMGRLKALFDQGKVAVQANVGTHYGDRFAHNSQTEAWLRGAELKYSKGSGWAAKMLELLSADFQPHYLQNVSLYGNNTWSSGETSSAFSIGPHNIPQTALYHHHSTALERKPNLQYHFENMANADNVLIREYAKTFLKTDYQSSDIINALSELPAVSGFSSNELAQQLRRVYELILLQARYGISRQIFFVGLPGFDTHRGQEAIGKNGLGYHANLLSILSESMGEFYDATKAVGMESQVTTFTMSEFGRTLVHNTGGGTDHGWGGHQLIMGGAVKGGLYGEMPRLAAGAANVLHKGILQPTTHAEQMTSGLAKWYGLSDSQCLDIFPILSGVNSVNYFV